MVPPGNTHLRPLAVKSSGTQAQGFVGVSASSGIRRSISSKVYEYLTSESAFIYGQNPCLHAEVQFLAFFLYGSSGTQAWSSAKADKGNSK
jgi:hypothetical protein